MAKYIPMELLQALSGKVCGHSDVYFANRGNTRYTGKICNPRTKAYSTTELARQNLFKSARTAMGTLTTQERTAYQTAFAAQSKYGSLNGYIFAQEYAKAKAAANANT